MLAKCASRRLGPTGKGSHGARPEEGIDPVLTACHVTIALQSIVSRNISPADTAVLSVTTIQAGDAYNVIPVRRAKARSLSRVSPTRQGSLQPVAIVAMKEVTRASKPTM
jgi:metal-dependent amidase/aminoacylase/carboxypeptidase family protein